MILLECLIPFPEQPVCGGKRGIHLKQLLRLALHVVFSQCVSRLGDMVPRFQVVAVILQRLFEVVDRRVQALRFLPPHQPESVVCRSEIVLPAPRVHKRPLGRLQISTLQIHVSKSDVRRRVFPVDFDYRAEFRRCFVQSVAVEQIHSLAVEVLHQRTVLTGH